MIGTTLRDIRAHIETLASDTGEYYLVCARYGDRPVPAVSLRFETRPVARAAARATEHYRAALRRYDPQLPDYDVIVCQDRRSTESASRSSCDVQRSAPAGVPSWSLSERVVQRSSGERCDLVEFCHRVSATVFETLSANDHDAVESAIMDVYFELAERLSSPDDLCLCLLESMATELAAQLSPTEQVTILTAAAARLEADTEDSAKRAERSPRDPPLDGALTRLRTIGLLEGFSRLEHASVTADGTGTFVVQFSKYALSTHDGRLPLLPVLVELHRRYQRWLPVRVTATESADDWRVQFVHARDAENITFSTCPVAPEVV